MFSNLKNKLTNKAQAIVCPSYLRRFWHIIKTIGLYIVRQLEAIPLAYKITAWYSMFLIIMIGLFAAFVMQFTHMWEDSEIRQELQKQVISMSDRPQKFRPYSDGVFLAVYTEDGIILKGGVPDGFPRDALPTPVIREIVQDNQTFYYFDAPLRGVPGLHGLVRGVVPLNTISRKSNNMLFALTAGGLLFLLIAAFGGYWVIRRGLRPIREITKTASQIGSQRDLTKRLPSTSHQTDEIGILATTLNKMLSSLEESSQREKRFSSDVSHELRTPISVIQAESDFGRTYTDSVEEAKESFGRIFKQCQHMTTMVSQLLEIARLDNMNQVEKEVFDFSHMANDLAMNYHVLAKDKNILFSDQVSPHIYLLGNEFLLRQSIANLIDNAFKFTTDEVKLSIIQEEEQLRIVVSDNGKGIAPDQIDKIWNRLYQVDPSRSSQNGSSLGLGLYFVSNVITMHDGQYVTHSSPGHTEFVLTIPINDTPE